MKKVELAGEYHLDVPSWKNVILNRGQFFHLWHLSTRGSPSCSSRRGVCSSSQSEGHRRDTGPRRSRLSSETQGTLTAGQAVGKEGLSVDLGAVVSPSGSLLGELHHLSFLVGEGGQRDRAHRGCSGRALVFCCPVRRWHHPILPDRPLRGRKTQTLGWRWEGLF